MSARTRSVQTYPCALCGTCVLFPALDSAAGTFCGLCKPIVAKSMAAQRRRQQRRRWDLPAGERP